MTYFTNIDASYWKYFPGKSTAIVIWLPIRDGNSPQAMTPNKQISAILVKNMHISFGTELDLQQSKPRHRRNYHLTGYFIVLPSSRIVHAPGCVDELRCGIVKSLETHIDLNCVTTRHPGHTTSHCCSGVCTRRPTLF